MRLTKDQLTEAINTIYAYTVEGKLDNEIMAEMGLDPDDYKRLKAAMFDAKADEVRAKPTEHVYVQYMIDQTQNIKDLTAMITEFKSTKQYNAMVGAIRARSEILDKLIEKGQEFGLIHKEPNRNEIVAGVLVADLTNKQLKAAITTELKLLSDMTRRYGDINIMDLAPGQIHRGPGLPAATRDSALEAPSQKKATKSTKSKNHRRSAGRKVVKQKVKT